MTILSDDSYDPSVHLSLSDLAIDHPLNPSSPFGLQSRDPRPTRSAKGSTYGLARRGLIFAQWQLYWTIYGCVGTRPGPLFDGRVLTRQHIVDVVRFVAVGFDKSKYCSHSFRIRADMHHRSIQRSRGLHHQNPRLIGEPRLLAAYVRIYTMQSVDQHFWSLGFPESVTPHLLSRGYACLSIGPVS